MKRMISCILCVCFLVGIFGVLPAAQAASYSGTENGGLNWTLDTESGVLTFSGSGTITSGGRWNSYRSQIRSIVIEDGVTAIGDSVFSGIASLTNISIANTVESIGNSTFAGCSNLTGVVVPDSVKQMGSAVFASCINLTEAVIGNGVSTVGSQMFGGCTALTTVTLGQGFTEIPDQMFAGCIAMTTVCMKGQIVSIGAYAFAGCGKLSAFEIPASVTAIGNYAFQECKALTSIAIPAGVTSIGVAAFVGCSNISAYTVAEGNTVYCSDDRGVLYDVKKTTLFACPESFAGSYEIPATVKTIGDNAFANCAGLTAIELKVGLESIGAYAFSNCSGISVVIVPEGTRSIGNYAFSGCSSLKSASLVDSITSFGSQVFYKCAMLESANIPAGITTVPAMTFFGCESLTEVSIPEGVTKLENSAFANCSSLKTIRLPSALESIAINVFADCSSLESIHIPAKVSSIANKAFNGCSSMTAYTVDAENQNFTGANGVLFNKDMSTLLLCPCRKSGDYEVPASVTTIGAGAFKSCGELTAVSFPEGLTTIGSEVFYKCISLEEVTIPDSVTSMGNYAFEYCSGLLEVKVGDGITTISQATFRGCANLTAITLPAGLTQIGRYCFEGSALNHIFFKGTAEQWAAINVQSNNAPLSAATLHCEVSGEEVYWDMADGRMQLHCALCQDFMETPCNHFDTIVTIPGAEPNCTQAGVTAGEYCSDCGETLVAQEVIPALGHNYDIVYTLPTCEEEGSASILCLNCNETLYSEVIPAMGHNLEYVNRGEDHVIVCKNRCDYTEEGANCANDCDYEVAEAHSFEEGICICGAEEISEPVLDSGITIGEQLYLESDLTMNFRIKESQLAAYDLSTAYMIVERDIYATDGSMVVDTQTITEFSQRDGRVIFVYSGIAASQMNDEIRLTFYIKDAQGKEYMSAEKITSVTTYAKTLLETMPAGYPKLYTVVMDMLNYGAAAQSYFNRHADAPANEAYAIFADYAAYATDAELTLEDLSMQTPNEGAIATISQTLDLGTRIGIQYKVALPAEVDAANAILVVRDAEGKELESILLSTGTKDTRGRYVVNFYGLASRQMRDAVTATLYVDDAAISDSYTYSISSYTYAVANTNGMPETLIKLTQMMLTYGDSAAIYFS